MSNHYARGIFKKRWQYKPNMPLLFTNIYEFPSLACREVCLKNNSGTGFVLKYKNKLFLVTAAHVIVNKNRTRQKRLSMDLKKENEERIYTSKVYYHTDQAIDLCVLSLPDDYESDYYLIPQPGIMAMGDHHLLFGYPGTLNITQLRQIDENHRIKQPIMRSGILSGISLVDDINYLYFDIVSLPGFSGGPLVSINKKGIPYVIGINVGSTMSYNKTLSKDGEPQDSYSPSPSGFAVALPIVYVLDIIEENNLVGSL